MPNKRSQMKGGWSKPKPRKTSTSANRKALRLSGAPPKRAKKSTARKLGDTYVKTIKWALPRVAGLHNPFVKGASKILPKWHPLSTKKKK